MDILQSLNSVVQGGHHLHLELKELLQCQGRWHRYWLAGTLVVLPLLLARTGVPGVHHLMEQEIHEYKILHRTERKLQPDRVERVE